MLWQLISTGAAVLAIIHAGCLADYVKVGHNNAHYMFKSFSFLTLHDQQLTL